MHTYPCARSHKQTHTHTSVTSHTNIHTTHINASSNTWPWIIFGIWSSYQRSAQPRPTHLNRSTTMTHANPPGSAQRVSEPLAKRWECSETCGTDPRGQRVKEIDCGSKLEETRCGSQHSVRTQRPKTHTKTRPKWQHKNTSGPHDPPPHKNYQPTRFKLRTHTFDLSFVLHTEMPFVSPPFTLPKLYIFPFPVWEFSRLCSPCAIIIRSSNSRYAFVFETCVLFDFECDFRRICWQISMMLCNDIRSESTHPQIVFLCVDSTTDSLINRALLISDYSNRIATSVYESDAHVSGIPYDTET